MSKPETNLSEDLSADLPEVAVCTTAVAVNAPEDSSLYWGGNNFFVKTLRFINLMEPGRSVISLSKTMIYLMMFIMLYVVINHPENTVAVLGASLSSVATLLNYGWRRYVSYRSGQYDTREINVRR
tara:strand:- start:1157 stop:1534 length:378 start_codon:yes stop_codon:yes gene_type:complete